MKTAIYALAMVVMSALPTLADGKESAMRHLAQVLAVANLCPKVEANSTAMAVVAVGFDIDLTRDGEQIRTIAREQMAAWQGKDEDAACLAGMVLYGPDGQNVPGLLSWK